MQSSSDSEMLSGNVRRELVAGDNPIERFEEDWLGFTPYAKSLADNLYLLSKTSGVCCGIVGGWGIGKTSFMRLMKKYVEEKVDDWKAVSVWLTAWDPVRVSDIADSMLYRIFAETVKDAKNSLESDAEELEKSLRKLQAALAVRRRAGQREQKPQGIGGEVGRDLPVAGSVEGVTTYIIDDLRSSYAVRDSFLELTNYLEKGKRVLFIFIDDLDRVTGEQILDILSKLKTYVSHRRIVIILGFDEEYVVKALEKTLPKGIDAEKYVEKIISVRKNTPQPRPYLLNQLAQELLTTLTPFIKKDIPRVAELATELCMGNPRRLKRIILSFIQSFPPDKKLKRAVLLSLIVVTVADEAGLLRDHRVRHAFTKGDEDDIIHALGKVVAEEDPRYPQVSRIIEALRGLRPAFRPEAVYLLGVSA